LYFHPLSFPFLIKEYRRVVTEPVTVHSLRIFHLFLNSTADSIDTSDLKISGGDISEYTVFSPQQKEKGY
jgi:hypothetical protein